MVRADLTVVELILPTKDAYKVYKTLRTLYPRPTLLIEPAAGPKVGCERILIGLNA